MKLLNRVIDKLQAALPPNRIAVLLAGPITAASGASSAWMAVHVPGIVLSPVEVTAFGLAAAAIAARMLDRWIDQWQKGEPLDFEEPLLELFADDDVRKVITEKFPELVGVKVDGPAPQDPAPQSVRERAQTALAKAKRPGFRD